MRCERESKWTVKKKNGFQRATLNICLVLLYSRENKWRRAHYAVRSLEWFFFRLRRRRRVLFFDDSFFSFFFFVNFIKSNEKEKKNRFLLIRYSSAIRCLRFIYLVLFIFLIKKLCLCKRIHFRRDEGRQNRRDRVNSIHPQRDQNCVDADVSQSASCDLFNYYFVFVFDEVANWESRAEQSNEWSTVRIQWASFYDFLFNRCHFISNGNNARKMLRTRTRIQPNLWSEKKPTITKQ